MATVGRESEYDVECRLKGFASSDSTVVEKARAASQDLTRPYGYVIYRATYEGGDEEWARFMSVFKAACRWAYDDASPGFWDLFRRLGKHHHMDIADHDPSIYGRRLRFDIFDDRSRFQNASINDICQHFRDWVSANDPDGPGGTPFNTDSPERQRYKSFLHVDNLSLQSVLANQSQWQNTEQPEYAGWVNYVEGSVTHDEEGFKLGTDLAVTRLSPTIIYPKWYTYRFGVRNYLEPPLVWTDDDGGYWPEKRMPVYEVEETPELQEELESLQDGWEAMGGMQGYLKRVSDEGGSAF